MARSLSCIVRLKQLIHNTSRPLTFSYLANEKLCKFYGTSLFISERHAKVSFEFDHGLEEKFKDIEGLKKTCQRRGCEIDVETLMKNYERLKILQQEKEDLESKRTENALKVNEIVKTKEKTAELNQKKKLLYQSGKDLKERFRVVQVNMWNLEQQVMEQALSIPNEVLPDVKDSPEVLESYLEGQKQMTNASHVDIMKSTGEVEFSNVGKRAYYLRGKLAILEQDLITIFSSELRTRGLTCMLAPEVFTTPIVEAGCIDVSDPSAINRVDIKHIDPELELDFQLDNAFLHGASHLSFLAYFARTIIDKSTPDSNLFVVGRNYKALEDDDLPGLLGAIQSVKVCMCSVNTEQEKSLVAMDMFQQILTDIYKTFKLPFRVVSAPLASLTAMEMKRIELQLWVPSLNSYLKMGSVSACGDYASRRLMTRCSENRSPDNTKPVFMVHSEVTDITRLIAILVEHGKTNDL